MKSCLILMATYNGEKFLAAQIDSIRNQTYDNWNLLIRDDGSNDNTKYILESYCALDHRIKFMSNETEKHGAFLNFWYLINIAYNDKPYDYYLFCDQDDIWENDKIEVMVNYAEARQTNKPLLVYSDMKIIDSEGKEKIDSINKVMGIGKMSGYTEFYSGGFIWGCAVMLNIHLFKFLPPLSTNLSTINIMSHDNYYAKLCLLIGDVHFLDIPLIKHREHNSNHTKGYNYKLSFGRIFKKFFALNELAKTHANGLTQTLVSFKHFKMNGIDLPIMREIETAINKGGAKGVKILKKHKVKRYQKSRTLGFYFIIYFKLYKKYLNAF